MTIGGSRAQRLKGSEESRECTHRLAMSSRQPDRLKPVLHALTRVASTITGRPHRRPMRVSACRTGFSLSSESTILSALAGARKSVILSREDGEGSSNEHGRRSFALCGAQDDTMLVKLSEPSSEPLSPCASKPREGGDP